MACGEQRIGWGVAQAWKIGLGQEVSSGSAVVQKRQQPGAVQTLGELEGAVWRRGSAGSAAAYCRCVRRAGVNPGLPAGCDQHVLKQGRSVLELEEACCAQWNGGPAGWSICASARSGGTIGGRSGGRNRWAATRWRRLARSITVGSSARVSSGVRRGRSPLVSGHFLAQ